MAINVTGPDGKSVSFPDGTPPARIKAVMSSVYAQPKAEPRDPDPRTKSDATYALASGILPFLDEVYGAGGAPFRAIAKGETLGEAYRAIQGDLSYDAKAYAKENPVRSTVAQVGGALMSGRALAAGGQRLLGAISPTAGARLAHFAQAAPKSATATRTVTAGGASGGVYGLGDAEGNLVERLPEAGKGALIGAAASPLGPLAVAGGAKVAPYLVRAGAKVMPATFGAAAERIRQGKGVDKVAGALARDSASPGSLETAAQEAADLGKPVAVFEMAGENTARLARAAANVPGEGADRAGKFLAARDGGTLDRLSNDADSISRGGGFDSRVGQLAEQRAAKAATDYGKANSKRFVWSDKLQGMFNRPIMQDALKGAVEAMRNKGVDPKGLGLDFNEAGDVIFKEVPSAEVLNYMKAGFNTSLGKHTDRFGRLDTKGVGGAALDAINEFKAELKKLNPALREADLAFAKTSAQIDAANLGRDLIAKPGRSPIEYQKAVAKMTPEERAEFRLGGREALDELLQDRKTGVQTLFGMLDQPRKLQRLRLLFDDNASYLKFVGQVRKERMMRGSKNAIMGGSRTAPLSEDIKDLQGDEGQILTGLLEGALTGSPVAAAQSAGARTIATKAAQTFDRWRTAGAPDEVARLLYQSDPRAVRQVLNLIEQRKISIEAAQTRLRGLMARAGGAVGAERATGNPE